VSILIQSLLRDKWINTRVNAEEKKISGESTFTISSFEELRKLVAETIKINF